MSAIPYPWLYPNVQLLSQAWQQGRFHHALLFQGVKGCGKLALADLIAAGMLCQNRQDLTHCGQCKSCLLTMAGHHPDRLFIPAPDTSIGIDAIRQVTDFSLKSPQIAERRVIVIEQVESMTIEAANALLKTLEEPLSRVFIILLSHQSAKLLPTIVSRCFKMSVKAEDKQQVYHWLAQQQQVSLETHAFETLFTIANGAPLVLQQWLAGQKYEQYQQVEQEFTKWRQGQLDVVHFRQTLEQDDFTVLLLEQLTLDAVSGAIINLDTKNQLSSGEIYSKLNQLFARLNQFSRDGAAIIGQNKTLALIVLLNQLDIELKSINC